MIEKHTIDGYLFTSHAWSISRSIPIPWPHVHLVLTEKQFTIETSSRNIPERWPHVHLVITEQKYNVATETIVEIDS